MNLRYWPLIPITTITAIVIAYILYSEERMTATNPLTSWFDAEDDIDYRPTAWDQAIGKNPRRRNA